MGPTDNETGVEVWSSEDWRERATAWLDAQLASAGTERTGAVEQPRVRPWATVLTAPTSRGVVWMKAAAPTTAFEAGLYEVLNRVVPERVLEPIAVDGDRGWILLPDGGPPLADTVADGDLAWALAAVLPHYGRFQRDLATDAEGLLALGVSDMRPAVMPARFDEALEAARRYVDQRGEPGDREALEQVAAMRETFSSWCERLATLPGPDSLDHNDLHQWNLLLGDLGRPERVKLYDWGDAVVAHPFSSMRMLGWGDYSAGEVERMRDAYLEPFADLAPHTELVEALELSCRVGKVARALTWDRAVRASAAGEVGDRDARAPFVCVVSLLDESYLGGA